MTQIIRRSFTLTEKDMEIIKVAVEKCGFMNDSEALRVMIKFYAEHARCFKT